MLFTNIIARSLFIGGGLAVPRPQTAKPDQLSPREYWAFAIKEASPGSSKRTAGALVIKLRDGAPTKRGPLDSQCEQADEGVYCTYTSADIEAFGTGDQLEEGCLAVDTGVSCFYPGATAADAQA